MGWGHSERARLRRFISNRNPTVSEMQSMWTWLSFRAATQILAERLLQFVNVSPPLGCQNILSWDSFGREVDVEGEGFRLRRLHYSALFSANVIPDPAEPEQGHFWSYALLYLADALADHGDDSEASRKIEIMAKESPQIFKQATRDVKRLLGVQTILGSRGPREPRLA
ncbi:hypothetical protein B0T21DRAFT_388958 [Apiosordaria backusii]|uniref:Uncharacterized protein n=1 Tax=Apiosordaria backusii TaxID=314023 RepID=A0AA40EZ40_9PEZI|nr:hypothetical protein B0T21DRAFT_388958 [Apiosordaria backusii]